MQVPGSRSVNSFDTQIPTSFRGHGSSAHSLFAVTWDLVSHVSLCLSPIHTSQSRLLFHSPRSAMLSSDSSDYKLCWRRQVVDSGARTTHHAPVHVGSGLGCCGTQSSRFRGVRNLAGSEVPHFRFRRGRNLAGSGPGSDPPGT